MSIKLPTHAQVVVIGGGVVGCSTAYHLTKLGWKDVVLLERKALTSGTTWAAAGLVGQLWASSALTKLAKYGTELYSRLEAETGQTTGFVRSGSVRVARTEARKSEYDRAVGMARAFGVEIEEISLEKAREIFPPMQTDDVVAAYYQPNDGHTSPVDTARAMAKGAQMGGASIFEGVKVTGVALKNNAVHQVNTDQGNIACEYVVNCAGMWGRGIGKKVGVSIPLHAAEHMHITTTAIEGVYHDMPVLRDMDGYIYFKQEGEGLLMGGFEPTAKPWGMQGIPEAFEFTELAEDWDQFELFMENAIQRCPAMEHAGIMHFTVVPESFTPDNKYMLGEAPGVKNFFVAAGMNSVGIASAAGAGKAISEWIVEGHPSEDLWEVDIRRFHRWQSNSRYLQDRITETVGFLYADHWPFKQPETARPVRCSPLHHQLKQRGACFGVLAGWERANWFALKGVEAKYEYSWGRQNWFEFAAVEHMAVRDSVGVYDLTSMAKFQCQGKDAEDFLQRVCANDVDVPIGKVVYTQLLNQRGGIEADLTVTRLAGDTFFIVTAGATEVRDFDWLSRHIPIDSHVVLTNVTSAYAMLGVMGPKSRDLLSTLTNANLSNDAFPFATAQHIDIAYARPLVLRMSYVGELGWELYVPSEFASGVFDALMAEGEKFDLRLVGLHAVDSLRLEKGYRHWGSDITPDDTPFEAGLGFAVKLNKGDFIGREALLSQQESGLTRKLVMFTLEDPQPLLYHDEPIYRNGELASSVTHGAYAHMLGCAMGMGYIENPEGISSEWILSGKYEIDVEGKLIPAKAYLKAPYDPSNKRVRM
ncbi:MAG: FAD-dependent oxidoreductase [Chloroflexi bacterium]|nr:FAD-dependent oxidoreductase [Chloroflexota bacterium]